MTSTDLEILKAIERNGVAYSVYWCHWPKMQFVGHPHVVVTASDLPCPFFNNVFSAAVPDSGSESVVDDLVGRFQSRSVPCFWWSGPVTHDERVSSDRDGIPPESLKLLAYRGSSTFPDE